MMTGERQEQPHGDTPRDNDAPTAPIPAAKTQQDDLSQTDAFEEEGAGLAAKE